MILQRISKALRKQDWFTVVIETLIVVFGVFIGLQVNNWNETRVDRAASIEYLDSMSDDIALSIDSLNQSISLMETDQAARLDLYHYSVDADAVLQPDTRDRMLRNGFYMVRSVHISQATFDTLKSTGRLEILGDREIVFELQSLAVIIEEQRIIQTDEYQAAYQFSDPMIIADFNMLNILRHSSIEGEPAPTWVPPSTGEESSSPAAMKSQRFTNIVLHRANLAIYHIRILRSMLDKSQHIAALIDKRQIKLGVMK